VHIKRSFAPIVGADTRLLILGSLPGDASLAQARYYAHPRNQFWRLLGDVLAVNLAALAYDERLLRLRNAGIGLWDVVASASREGSLDMRIRGHVPNELATLVANLPNLRAIAFNGTTASRIGRRQLASVVNQSLIDLPSSSPANTLTYEAKRQSWLGLAACLSGPATGQKP
jgi:hypoxanthine-DNA glycosylase